MINIQIVFGSEAVCKMIHKQPLTEEEKNVHQKTYTFATMAEQVAFVKGIEEAVGWQQAYVVADALHAEY
jgi:hypothetical protein